MNILYVYAYPNPSSFNSILKSKALDFLKKKRETNIVLSDLYAVHFKSNANQNDFKEPSDQTQYFLAQEAAYQHQHLSPDIATKIEKISWAHHLIFQFPLQWFSTPAILKRWLDRVLVKGFAYEVGKIFEQGLLKGKTATLVLTTQSPESAYQDEGVHGAKIEVFLHRIHHTLHFTGIKSLEPFVVYGAFNLEETQKEAIFKKYELYLENLIAGLRAIK